VLLAHHLTVRYSVAGLVTVKIPVIAGTMCAQIEVLFLAGTSKRVLERG
jgi:hypothetical protein